MIMLELVELDHVKEERKQKEERMQLVWLEKESKYSNLGNLVLKGASKGSCHQIEAT